MSNNTNVSIIVSSNPMTDRTGKRGRPQKHPQVTFDFSGAPKAMETLGEKRVRNAATRQLRAHLGLGETIPCTEHPKDPTRWILKAECGRDDYHVTVVDVESSTEG